MSDDENKMKYTVTPSVDFKAEILEVKTEVYDSIAKAKRTISIQVMQLQNEATRKGLIALGWTPPKD
jgi:hypothetical protein